MKERYQHKPATIENLGDGLVDQDLAWRRIGWKISFAFHNALYTRHVYSPVSLTTVLSPEDLKKEPLCLSASNSFCVWEFFPILPRRKIKRMSRAQQLHIYNYTPAGTKTSVAKRRCVRRIFPTISTDVVRSLLVSVMSRHVTHHVHGHSNLSRLGLSMILLWIVLNILEDSWCGKL